MVQVLGITDPERYDAYRREVTGLTAGYGGRVIVGRNSRRQALEGTWDPEVLLVIEFPSYEAAERWYFSEAYQAALPGRIEACECKALLAEEQ